MNKKIKNKGSSRIGWIGMSVVLVLCLGFIAVSAYNGDGFVKTVIENVETYIESPATPEEGPLGAIEFNTGKVVFDQLAEGVLQENVIFLSSAEVASISETPKLLIADPGANKVIQVESITGFRSFSSESFVYKTSTPDQEGFEVKWGNVITASGMNGQVAMGASFSTGFVNGGTHNTAASPSIEIWRPSIAQTTGAYSPVTLGSASTPVYLTASTAFNYDSAGDVKTNFYFRVIYRILRLPQS